MTMTPRNKHGIDYRSLADFRYQIRRFLNFSERAAREAGIEPHQHQALLGIKGLPIGQKATVGALAERLQVKHHTAVELINRLQAKKLIRRTRNGPDRREVMLALTHRGEHVLTALTRLHRAELRSAGPVLLRVLNAVLVQGRSRSSRNIRASQRRSE